MRVKILVFNFDCLLDNSYESIFRTSKVLAKLIYQVLNFLMIPGFLEFSSCLVLLFEKQSILHAECPVICALSLSGKPGQNPDS